MVIKMTIIVAAYMNAVSPLLMFGGFGASAGAAAAAGAGDPAAGLAAGAATGAA